MPPGTAPEPPRGPWFETRRRWRVGQALLVLAALFTLLAFARPLARSDESPWLSLLAVVGLGLGVAASALVASLKGQGQSARLALYAFLVLSLDGLGQLAQPLGWPIWPLFALLVGAVAVAESLPVALAVASLAALMTAAEAWDPQAHWHLRAWRQAVAAAGGYFGLALALHQALRGEKRRLAHTLAELTSLQTGIDHLAPDSTDRLSAVVRGLRDVSDEGRRARQADHAQEREEFLTSLMHLARGALRAHAVLYFDVDQERGVAALRAADCPAPLVPHCLVPLNRDPFGFVMQRRQPFYVTDFKRLLWELPYYERETHIGALLAVPVRLGETVSAVLVADSLDTQALSGGEADLLQEFGGLSIEIEQRLRGMVGREERGLEFSAIYGALQQLKTLQSPATVRQFLLRSAQNLVAVEAAAVVSTDGERYVVEAGLGWAHEFETREVSLLDDTWLTWVLQSAESATLISDLAHDRHRRPLLVLDEGPHRAEAFLALPLRVQERTLGAVLVTARRGELVPHVQRIMEVLAQQAATVLRVHQLNESERRRAMEDGLTALSNRRAFDHELARAVAQADRRQADGKRASLALLLLDIDRFKLLNDTFGHPAGDAALKRTASTLKRLLRLGDSAARYGGEEFVVILPDTEQAGAQQLAERVRAALEQDSFTFESARLTVTASFGVALFPGDGGTPEALVSAADRALYAAKQAGRNRVVAASSLPAQPEAAKPQGQPE